MITTNEIESIIKKLPTNRSSGPDGNFGGDGYIYYFEIMVSQVYIYIRIHQIVYFIKLHVSYASRELFKKKFKCDGYLVKAEDQVGEEHIFNDAH